MEVEGGSKLVQTYGQLAIDMPLGPQTGHKSGTDSWLQLGFLLGTCTNSVFVLGYSGTIMVPLGWAGGVIGLVVAAAISFYANALIAKLHEHGGKRHIRYRDLAGYIYGWKGYTITWVLQYLNLFLINSGLIILGGFALKAVYALFRDDHEMKLPYFIIMGGFICVLFAISTPTLSSLRVWLGVSTICSLFFILVATVLSIKDGIKAMPRDYSVKEDENRIFTVIGAVANLVFAFNSGMLPEIQATVKQPVVENMLKALYFQFSVAVIPVYALTFLGYWAYGNSTSAYLLNNVNGPVWIKTIANIFAFLQSVISLHVFASPTYEYLDTKFRIKGSALAWKNLAFRVAGRGGYLAFNTLISALLPFLGDFLSLSGALSIFPLAFILANHMYLLAKKDELGSIQKFWHWLNVIFFSLMAIVATVAALRLIAIDSQTYSLFADV